MSSGGPAAGVLRAGSLVAGKFLLQRPLGQGGMGAVWLAEHTALKTPCAVKFLHPGGATSADVRARFEREAVAAAQLRSPHVVQILDHGVWEGAPYIAMELLEGEDLSQRLRRVGRLSLRETAAIVSQVARALGRAHAAGLIHRDLKPANIFLVRDDDREIAKVLDFGIAKVGVDVDVDARTQTGALLGTPYYMSPEQAQGARDLDYRSDLWALAVLTFQCVTGVLPFSAQAMGALFMLIIVKPLPVPSEVAAASPVAMGGVLPAAFDAWWVRAASRDPAGRFQSAKELSEALNLALGITTNTLGDGELSVRLPAAAAAGPLGARAGDLTPAPEGAAPLGALTPLPRSSRMDASASAISLAIAPPRSRVGLLAVLSVVGAALLAGAGWVASRAPSAMGAAHLDPVPTVVPMAAPASPDSRVAAEPGATPSASGPAVTPSMPPSPGTSTAGAASSMQATRPPAGTAPMPRPQSPAGRRKTSGSPTID